MLAIVCVCVCLWVTCAFCLLLWFSGLFFFLLRPVCFYFIAAFNFRNV